MATQTFDFQLELDIITKSAELSFYKTVTLPFVPAVGTELLLVDGDDRFVVNKVMYYADDNVFVLLSRSLWGDDCPCTAEDNCCGGDEEDDRILARQLKRGWEVDGDRRGAARVFLQPWSFPSPTPVSDSEPK